MTPIETMSKVKFLPEYPVPEYEVGRYQTDKQPIVNNIEKMIKDFALEKHLRSTGFDYFPYVLALN